MQAQEKRRFILVDPSFDGTTGDKLQYALSFYISAIRNDFDFVLLAHKNSPSMSEATNTSVDQRNIFDHNFYSHGLITQRHKAGQHHQLLERADASCNAALAALDERILKLESASRFVEAARLRGERSAILKQHIESTEAEHSAVAAEKRAMLPFNRDDLALVLASELRKLQLRSGDVLFLHTATQAMLESLSEMWLYLDDLEPIDAQAYFLLHFGAEAPDARTFVDRYYSFSHMNSLGLRLRSGSPFRSLFLLATNTKLRDELEYQLGVPVGIFDGLTNFDRYMEALGGAATHECARTSLLQAVAAHEIAFGVRAADLDDARLNALRNGVLSLSELGFSVKVYVAHHDGNVGRGGDFVARCTDLAFKLVNTQEHADYIRFLADVTVMVLPYRPDVYRKRVSAVLHDCAVLGISCIVPRNSTLEDGRQYADIYAYGEPEELPGAMFRAATALASDGTRSKAKFDVAAKMFTTDVIKRLVTAMKVPSVTANRRGPVATVIMPLWGRVGSSYAIEAQIRYLLENGYFVIQIFVLDKAVDLNLSASHFWRMLFENSSEIRGHIQRIAYREEDISAHDQRPDASGFDVFLDNMAANDVWDANVAALVPSSDLMVVNHVFHSRFARKLGARPMVLETHDIQSHQMMHWPLRDPRTGQPERFEQLYGQEIAEVAQYDYVVNVSDVEHARLSLVNPRSRIVTPYIPRNDVVGRYKTVDAMARAHNWDSAYHGMSRFDLLLLGDRHPANVESAIWFVNQVFKPFLQPNGFTLAIVGRLSDGVYAELGSVGYVYYCGFVEKIPDVRALSTVTVLPDRRGSGISIKTLETLAYGGAFVATSVAFRGIASQLANPPQTYDQPQDFAHRCAELIRDPMAQRDMHQAALKYYDAVASKPVFDAAWTDICETLTSRGAVGVAQ